MANDLRTTIAANLQSRMDYMKLSVEQVAKLSDMDPYEIRKILSGWEVPTEVLMKLADALLMYVSHLTGELPLKPFNQPEQNLKSAGYAREFALEAIKSVVKGKATISVQSAQQAIHSKLNTNTIPQDVLKKLERYVPTDILEALAIRYPEVGKKVEALLFDRKKV